MKSKIILILLISSLIIGCVNAPSNNEISETVSSITKKLLEDCGKTLTTEQCDYWVENSINNKYVRWSGTVSNVIDGVVYVNVDYKFPSSFTASGYVDNIANVKLHDIRKDEILKLNKNDNIQFTGKINIKKDILNSYSTSWLTMTTYAEVSIISGSGVDLYDSKIINPDNTDSSKSNVKSGISSGTPTHTSGISRPSAYHIDTLPPGKGVVYINNKLSPSKGTLPPGSYNIKLVVGSKTYESTMSAVEGGSIELIQPIPTVTPISNIIPIRPP